MGKSKMLTLIKKYYMKNNISQHYFQRSRVYEISSSHAECQFAEISLCRCCFLEWPIYQPSRIYIFFLWTHIKHYVLRWAVNDLVKQMIFFLLICVIFQPLCRHNKITSCDNSTYGATIWSLKKHEAIKQQWLAKGKPKSQSQYY